MSRWVPPSPSELWWTSRRSSILLFAVHLPFLLVPPLVTAIGLENPPPSAWLVAALASAIAALQLRHSFATSRGELPRRWPLTLAALGLCVFVPLPWFGIDWASSAWFFVASAAMLLTGRLRLLFVVVPVVGIGVWAALLSVFVDHAATQTDIYYLLYWAAPLLGGGLCLCAAAHLVRAVEELFTTRAELAEAVLGRERVRLSRDLHDLLGQSLTAVSLKGDLALALLRGGSGSAAEEELRSLVEVAREALHDIRHVVHDEHPVSLHTETNGARALLTAASIDAKIDADVDNLPRPIDELLGWATREGVTNMLRHSQASSCSIRAARENGAVLLEIVNDGADHSSASGTGIAGLRERAHALTGSVIADRLADGQFRLLVQVPEAAEASA
jgi:two-component system, NarL family, sensor histidine kinase DesK